MGVKTAVKIGLSVLETLTTGLYVNPLDCLREYVQNAADAIRQAEAVGVLPLGGGKVTVRIWPENRTIEIQDNGISIPFAEAGFALTEIGCSSKDPERNAGFRGIGRLGGLAYCDKLHFQASAAKEPLASINSFDCVAIRALIRSRPSAPIEEFMRHYSEEAEDAPAKDRYFRVVMGGGVNPALLDEAQVKSYLSQVAPVGFHPQFAFGSRIEGKARSAGFYLPVVALFVNNAPVYKPYSNTLSSKKGEIKLTAVEARPIGKDCLIWWGVSEEIKSQIREAEQAGFRIRRDNIAIGGPEITDRLYAEISPTSGRFNRWRIGEVHLRGGGFVPTARRDDLEATPEWGALRVLLLNEAFRSLKREDHMASQIIKEEGALRKGTRPFSVRVTEGGWKIKQGHTTLRFTSHREFLKKVAELT